MRTLLLLLVSLSLFNLKSYSQANGESQCKSYVNFLNKTSDPITVKVYKENLRRKPQATPIYTFTIAAGKSKKQKVEKDVDYYYYAAKNTSRLRAVEATIGGGWSFEGTFEGPECNSTIDEEIE